MDIYEVYQRPAHRGAQSRDQFRTRQFSDFDCCHCGLRVSANPLLSGVNHRNHCPHCLWSRHMDLLAAGDRLCACKGPMQPVGLTFKRVHKKYAPAQPGELMLIHRCTDPAYAGSCGAVSINRVAADDSAPRLWAVFQDSLARPLALAGIDMLGPEAQELVRARIF